MMKMTADTKFLVLVLTVSWLCLLGLWPIRGLFYIHLPAVVVVTVGLLIDYFCSRKSYLRPAS